MRCLLVNPHYPIEEMPSPPLGLGFLAAVLERADVQVEVLDLVTFPYSKRRLASVLQEFRPQMLGATAVTMTFDGAARVIRDAKEIDPDILTVMGGPHISFCAPESLRALPELDLAALGEGEDTIVELADALRSGKSRDPSALSEIAGIAYRDGSEIRSTGIRPPTLDVSALPLPARHLLPLGRYKALGTCISMVTSRGCPFRCIFCVGRHMVGKKVRYRPAKAVVDELEYLGGLGFCQVNIADDLFTVNGKHCLSICDEILARGLQVKWTSFARVDTVSTELLSRMREAGCTTVSFGCESANAEILKTVEKGITAEQMIAAAKMCKEAGMLAQASFIAGLPGETPQTLDETVKFTKTLREEGVLAGFHLLAPFPGTAVRDRCRQYGIRILTDDWSEYHANKAIVETPTVDREMLDAIAREIDEETLRKLHDTAIKMANGEATEEERTSFLGMERTALFYDLMMTEALDEAGSWPVATDPGQRQLSSADIPDPVIGAIERRVGSPPAKIRWVLQEGLDRGFLRWRVDNGQLGLQWVDTL